MVVDYRDPDATEQVHAAAPNGVEVYWDTSGHHDCDATLPLLARGDRMLVTAAGPNPTVLPITAAYTHDVSLHGFVISNATIPDLAAAAWAINRHLAEGTLTARIAEVLPLSQAAEAHRMVESGEVSGGRLVLQTEGTP